jgi:Family of unknown function (DUF6492)
MVIPDSELLPRWMKAVKRPFDRAGRHLWISTDIRKQIRPLSGWHVQQLRKLAAARLVSEDLLVMADSDSVFVRPFSADHFLRAGKVRLYRKPGAIQDGAADGTTKGAGTHAAWTRHAALLLGLPPPVFPADDFINNLVSWRKDQVLAMLARIEARSSAPFELTLGRAATLSEYQIYGAFMRGVAEMQGHFDSPDALSHTYWTGEALTRQRLSDFMAGLQPHQVALCIQSFTETPLDLLRGLFRSAERAVVRM